MLLQKQKLHTALRACQPLLGGLLGICVFCCIYGVSTLRVGYDSWIYAGYIEEDIIQSYAGWQFFRASAWHFPLALMDNVAQPVGAGVAYTDPYFIWALVCKLFAPLLPKVFQYFGWANLCNFFLQGVTAWLLLRLFTQRVWPLCAGTLLFLCMPVFIERAFRHSALGAQWLILWALYLYFSGRRKARPQWWGWGVLVCLAPLVHAYFLPIVLAVMAASVLDYMVRQRVFWGAAWRVALCGAACVAVCLGTGLVMPGGGNSASGYGLYSMNLNAPFNPSSFNYLGGGVLDWSAALPVLPQRYHNYDGFNYFGLGVLLALAALAGYGVFCLARAACRHTLRALRQRAGAFLRSHFALLAACVCCAAFAVSHIVCWGDKVLFTLPIPGLLYRLGSMFRSSGRMFYLITYLCMLSLIVFALRRFSARAAAAVLTVLLAVQVGDSLPVLAQKHAYFAQPVAAQDVYETDEWRWFVQNHSHAVCVDYNFDYRLAAGLIRYNADMQSNIVFFNRGDYSALEQQYKDTFAFLVSGAPLPDDTMYICEGRDRAGQILTGLNENAAAYRMGRYYVIANIRDDCPAKPAKR